MAYKLSEDKSFKGKVGNVLVEKFQGSMVSVLDRLLSWLVGVCSQPVSDAPHGSVSKCWLSLDTGHADEARSSHSFEDQFLLL